MSSSRGLLKIFTSSSSSEDDSSDEDSEEDSEEDPDPELLSLSEPDSESSFFFSGAFPFGFSSEESDDPESESYSDEDYSALPLGFLATGVAEEAYYNALAVSFAARASSSDQIGFSLKVASCFS